jgi:hypothetical protein
MKKIATTIALLLFIYNCLNAEQTLFMSPSGNDNNPGTKDKPLASLSGARQKIRELRHQTSLNDTIFVSIAEGTYLLAEPFVLSGEDSGTEQSPVVFTADPKHRPIFCGGMKIKNFDVVEPYLWRTYIPETALFGFNFEQLYINGERRFRAQTPNHGEFFRVKSAYEVTLDTMTLDRSSSFASQKITLHEAQQQMLNDIAQSENIENILVIFYHNWDNTRKRIEHINIQDTALYISGNGMKPWNPINAISRYVIENYPKALDAPGEWYLQRDGYLYYIPMPGETPDNIECIAPVTEHFVILNGTESKPVKNIRFENIRFEVSAYHTPANGNEPAQAAAPIEAAIMADYVENIEFLNCDIAHTGTHGIWFRTQCYQSGIEHCHLYDLGGGGVKIGTTTLLPDDQTTHHIVINNNIIQHGGYVFPCGVGVIIFHGSDNEISHNDIADFRYSSVSVGWIWGYAHSPSKRNKIIFNHLHHLGWGELCDMGGVYTLGASEGTLVANNTIHHIYSFNYGGWGLYTDEGSYKVVMENNLVYACRNSGFHQHYGKDNIIRNNIFANNLRAQLQLTRAEEHRSFSFTNNIIFFDKGLLYTKQDSWLKARLAVDHNCYWDTRTKTPDFEGLTFAEWKKQLGRDQHSIIADPLFTDPENFDFRFKNESTAKKINFKPFDYSNSGVYGSAEWKDKARLSTELLQKFDEITEKIENSR